jgi:hypothetical protein
MTQAGASVGRNVRWIWNDDRCTQRWELVRPVRRAARASQTQYDVSRPSLYEFGALAL